MYDTESVFNVLAADDTGRRVASRRALALASIRVEAHLGEFLRQASSTDDFEARFAACKEEFEGHILTAAEEHGYEHPEYIARSLFDHYVREARVKQSGSMMGLPPAPAGINQQLQEAQPQVPPPTTPQQMQQMGPQQQMPDPLQPQDLGQNLGLGQQMGQPMPMQGILGKRQWTPFLADKTSGFGPQQPAPQPAPVDPNTNPNFDPWAGDPRYPEVAYPDSPEMGIPYGLPEQDPYAEQYGYPSVSDNLEVTPHHRASDSHMISCPECGGNGKTASRNPCPKCKGRGKVADFGPSVLDELESSVHTAEEKHDNTELGGPEPKMDKRLWTPETVGDPDPASREHPTKKKDILQPLTMDNADKLEEIGEQTTEHEKLPAAGDNSGFDSTSKPGPAPHTDTWHSTDGQADPVTKSALE